MLSFPIRPLALALFGLGLATGAAFAQAPAPAEAVAPSAELVPTAALAEGGAALGDDVPVAWELYAIAAGGKAGARVAHAGPGAVLSAPPGDYILLAKLDLAFAAAVVTIAPGMNTVPVLALNAGLLELTPALSLAGEVYNGAASYLVTADGTTMSYVGPFRTYVPAGEVKATVVFDAVRTEQSLQVRAGETVAESVVVMAAAADVRVSTGAFVLPEGLHPRIDIFAAPTSADGALRMVVFDMLAERRFILPPGDYVAQGLVEGANTKVPFSLKAGEIAPVALDLAAGLLRISAPGANSLAVMAASDNPAEPWRMIYHQFDLTALEYVVVEGNYLVEAYFETGKVEKTAHVAAGETAKVTLP
ncbi:MAG: hypothetical protein Q8Q63_07100 [Phaeovulum sp.]|uniref:hypothetical protein n=1 Tax=Phaeovulum sp. TaxID=2934796 RepID=UPI0027328B8D|nr:hypothetical protein [Phaeovulum sp.]MDP3861335.1 hypothetical protein [Phaeovulum sp.]